MIYSSFKYSCFPLFFALCFRSIQNTARAETRQNALYCVLALKHMFICLACLECNTGKFCDPVKFLRQDRQREQKKLKMFVQLASSLFFMLFALCFRSNQTKWLLTILQCFISFCYDLFSITFVVSHNTLCQLLKNGWIWLICIISS